MHIQQEHTFLPVVSNPSTDLKVTVMTKRGSNVPVKARKNKTDSKETWKKVMQV